MVMTSTEWRNLRREHQALLTEYGRAQLRCSRALARQAARIKALETQVMQLRGEVMLRDTALAWGHEDHARLVAAQPDLPRRFALAQHVNRLAERIQSLLRERNARQWLQISGFPRYKLPTAVESLPSVVPATARSVLCVGRDETTAGAARAFVETAGGRFLQHDGADDTDEAGLEASLVAADLVICQTGCVSHNAFWRVRDHCKRTGKQCVLVDQPCALDAIQAAKQPAGHGQ